MVRERENREEVEHRQTDRVEKKTKRRRQRDIEMGKKKREI